MSKFLGGYVHQLAPTLPAILYPVNHALTRIFIHFVFNIQQYILLLI